MLLGEVPLSFRREIMDHVCLPMHHLHSCASGLGSQEVPLNASSSSAELALLSTSTSNDHVSLDQRFVTNEIEANRLKEIDSDVRLRLILADWQSRLKESQERKERKHTLSLNVKNEIYHLIGFFSVFQGVVLTTVSQASQLTCHNLWGPFALSLLASVTTLGGVCNKFHNFIKWKRATDIEVENTKVLKGQISRLKKFGADFKFSEHAPNVRHKTKKEFQQPFNRYYILAVLVVVSMMGFSVIMLVSCQRILCDQGGRSLRFFWHNLVMRKGATVLENGTHSAFEVIRESSSGVHTALKTLAPQEKFTLERSSSDSFLQLWVQLVKDSVIVVWFNSDELVDNDRIIIVCEGDKFNKVMIPRVFKSHSMPNRRLQALLQEGEEGHSSDMYSVCKPPLRKSFKRLYNSLTRRASEDPLTEEAPHGPANSHPLNHLHSI